MLEDPALLAAALATIVALVVRLEASAALAPLFSRLPAVFWIYLLPMLATSAGLLPAASPLYDALRRHLLPAVLVLMLLSADLRAIARLGPRALVAMAGASFGVALGAVIAFLLFGAALGAEAWKGLAALTGTWIGGSANLLAVATSLELSPEVQGTAIVVDTVVGYSWMAILIALSAKQAAFDRRLGAERGEIAAIGERVAERSANERRPLTLRDATAIAGVAIAVSAVAMAVGAQLPQVGQAFGPFAWGILLATSAGLALSLTPVARLDAAGASSLGYAGFYLLLASVGAQADVRRVFAQPLWLAAGVTIILVHALVLLLTLRLLRAPSFYFGAASQAAVGGYSSAPIVAEIWQRGLAPVGLLLAVVGAVAGTYVGLGVAELLASFSR